MVTSCCSRAACPGEIVKSTDLHGRCTQTGYYINYDDVSGPSEILIILQPDPNVPMTLWWSYTPNPTRQVDTCHLANNQVCDYDTGKCLMGTDCSDCGESDCQATECISAYRFRDQVNIPDTCDDPEWKSLLPGRVNVGSKGPWDCRSLQNEMRLDCSGCRCEIEGGHTRVCLTVMFVINLAFLARRPV